MKNLEKNYHDFGLTKEDIEKIKLAIGKLPEIEKAVVFGSRAMGNYKKGSDIDIAILGENITRKTVNKLHVILNEECILQYFFDIVDYNKIQNEKLKEHINTYGKEIFNKFINLSVIEKKIKN